MTKKPMQKKLSKKEKLPGYLIVISVILGIAVLVTGFYIFRYVKNQHDMTNIEKKITSIQTFMSKENNQTWHLKKECNQYYAGLLKKLPLKCKVMTTNITFVENAQKANELIDKFQKQFQVQAEDKQFGMSDVNVDISLNDRNIAKESQIETITLSGISPKFCQIGYSLMDKKDALEVSEGFYSKEIRLSNGEFYLLTTLSCSIDAFKAYYPIS